uniref:Uncharacterized protein n=1 Tax=Rhizophagus irregularis (strain DAOM 181602 / DAOM 197198 / MUCL 43194) TaxID=747089 RepID=U9TVX1_RHIID
MGTTYNGSMMNIYVVYLHLELQPLSFGSDSQLQKELTSLRSELEKKNANQEATWKDDDIITKLGRLELENVIGKSLNDGSGEHLE